MRARCGLWMVVPIDPFPIDRSIDRSKNRTRGGAVRNAVGTDLSRRLSISLHVERWEPRQRQENTSRPSLDWYSGTNTCTGSLEDVLDKVQSWVPTARCSKSGEAGNFSCGFVVHAPLLVSIFDPLRRSRLKKRLSKWRIQVALVHEIRLSRHLTGRENCQLDPSSD